MSRRLALVHTSDHGNDLPPWWDGVPVIWSEWLYVRTSMAFHESGFGRECPKCGSRDEGKCASGRSGEGNKPLWLLAQRCPDCLHDTVYVHPAGEHWDLDHRDYDDRGSTR